MPTRKFCFYSPSSRVKAAVEERGVNIPEVFTQNQSIDALEHSDKKG